MVEAFPTSGAMTCPNLARTTIAATYASLNPIITTAYCEQIEDTARSMGDSAGTLAGDLTSALKERPYTTIAIAAGLAFAFGALWKLSHRQPASRIDRLRAQLPDVPRARELQHWLQSQDVHAWLPKGWR